MRSMTIGMVLGVSGLLAATGCASVQKVEGEVQTEQKALEDARAALSSGQEVRNGNERNYQKYLDRVKGLQDAVDAHQSNLDALQKEIANLR